MLNQFSLKAKLISGFLLVAMMVLVVGATGWLGIQGITEKNSIVARTTPLIDAAMEMKIAVSQDMVVLMELLEAEEESSLNELWEEHESQVASFDTYSDGVIKGVNTPECTIYAAESEVLRGLVSKTSDFHDNQFQPRMKSVYNDKLESFDSLFAVNKAMGSMENTSDEVIRSCEDLEVMLSDQMNDRLNSGVSADELLSQDLKWIDIVMELKSTILTARITIEEYVQSSTPEELATFEGEYQETVEDFDTFCNYLLKGGDFEGSIIAPLTHSADLIVVGNLDKSHEEFHAATVHLMEAHTHFIELAEEVALLDAEADKIGNQMFGLLAEVEELADAEVTQAQDAAIHRAKSAKFQALLFVSIGLVMAISLGIFLSLSITRPINRTIDSLNKGAEQVASASSQVAESSQQMAEGASEQASSLEETAASLEMMSSMARESSGKTEEANQKSREVKIQAEKGQAAMANLDDAMKKIKSSSEETAKIIKTIDEIAFQTNLLALNAAVEAARAGDAGKGFAVVAEEVRNLAQRSAEAAKNTTILIDESNENSNLGVRATEDVAELLGQVVEGILQISDLVDGVAGNSDGQSKSVEEVNSAVGQMDQVTQGNAASAEESASAAEEMSAQASEMQKLVQTLVTIVSGAGAQSGSVQQSYSYNNMDRAGANPPSRAPNNRDLKSSPPSPDMVIPLDDDCFISL